MVTNQKCWCSALDERVTNDDEQRRTNHFQRAPRAFFMQNVEPGVTGPVLTVALMARRSIVTVCPSSVTHLL